MTGNVVDRLGAQRVLSTTVSTLANGNGSTVVSGSDGVIDPAYAVTIATTLAFTVGIVHVIFVELEVIVEDCFRFVLLAAAVFVSTRFRHFVSLRHVHQRVHNRHGHTGVHVSGARHLWSDIEALLRPAEHRLREELEHRYGRLIVVVL